jgi:hypothetical protein
VRARFAILPSCPRGGQRPVEGGVCGQTRSPGAELCAQNGPDRWKKRSGRPHEGIEWAGISAGLLGGQEAEPKVRFRTAHFCGGCRRRALISIKATGAIGGHVGRRALIPIKATGAIGGHVGRRRPAKNNDLRAPGRWLPWLKGRRID